MFNFRTGFTVYYSLTVCNFSCFRLKAEFQRYQSYNYNDYYQDYQNYYSQWGYDPYTDYNYSSYAPYDSMQAVGDCSLGDAVMAPAVFEVKILHTCFKEKDSQIVSCMNCVSQSKKSPKTEIMFFLVWRLEQQASFRGFFKC